MQLIAFILLLLFFVQSYFFYGLFQKNSALDKKYEDAVLAIQYHEKKNLEMAKQVQGAKDKNAEMHTRLTIEKIDHTELKSKNDQLKQTINQLEQKNNSQAIFLQQKDNEILILKNELLKYLSEWDYLISYENTISWTYCIIRTLSLYASNWMHDG